MDALSSRFSQMAVQIPQIQRLQPDMVHGNPTVAAIQGQHLQEAQLAPSMFDKTTIGELARSFCAQWQIPDLAATNFINLARGNLKYPVLMLQNPTNKHHIYDFNSMFDASPTLLWIEDALRECKLQIRDIVILDICPLLSNEWIQNERPERVAAAITAAYQLMERILDILKPKIIISMQCVTKDNSKELGRYATPFVRQLGSSTNMAREYKILPFRYNQHDFYVVQAYHPRFFVKFDLRDGRVTYKVDPDDRHLEVLLKNIMRYFLEPCGARKWQLKTAAELEASIAQLRSAVIALQQGQNGPAQQYHVSAIQGLTEIQWA